MHDSNTIIGVFITLVVVAGLVLLVMKHRKNGTYDGSSPSYREQNKTGVEKER